MTQRTYDTITLACLLTAVASAVAFQHAEAYQVVAGIFGVLSGLLAAATYYVYHVRPNKRSDGKQVAEPKDNPDAALQLSSHPQIRKMMATLSEVPGAVSDFQAMFEVLARDLPAGSAKSVWKSPVSGYRIEREIQQHIEREFLWMQLNLLSSREAGRDARRASRAVMVRPKLYKGTAPLDKTVMHKVRPKSQRAAVWESDMGAFEVPGSWSEPAHRAA